MVINEAESGMSGKGEDGGDGDGDADEFGIKVGNKEMDNNNDASKIGGEDEARRSFD